ncbi:MAG: sorbosone dehydrogenase family protein [Alphaproteobacteria bacterium]|nr:sorbosone dehydrogenase family protein [Alphaproteobacteria bacterium]MBV9370843.1 sorbosone dehydrogenase family protein [Alphaproteobacteria bacterium]MBV9901274.1 sorbosone dehydrogenase family protein [Alphaproteobacteria bacterium]
MTRDKPAFLAILALSLGLAACGDRARLRVEQGMGPSPALPPPVHAPIPTVNVAKAVHWPAGAAPVAAAGLRVRAFARGLDHPRWLAVLPNGDVLVAETNAPERPKDGRGLKGFFFKLFQKKAGGAVPSANRITLLRDADGDGVAETRSVLLAGLNAPFGMALSGDTLYVADTDAVLAFPYRSGETSISAAPRRVADLPAGEINHHWTKNLLVSPDGGRIYVAIGSNSNVGENGLPAEEGRAAIWLVDPATGEHRPYATGLRNPVGLAFEPATGALWTTVNERDEIGSDLVPDYMTRVADGGFYGWPFSYYGQHPEERIKPRDRRPDLVARAIVPDYALGPHTASLGLAFAQGARLGPAFAGGAFVGQHGSWNRKPRSGYKVVFVPFADGRPSGPARDVLTGFLTPAGEAMGRPVGVAVDRSGALLVADDVGNTVWRVTAAD